MTAFNLPPQGTEANGLAGALSYLAGQLPFLFPTILFFIWITIFSSGFGIQRMKSIQNKANMPMWASISSFITSIVAIILYLMPGVLDIATVSICIVATIIFTTWFIFTTRE